MIGYSKYLVAFVAATSIVTGAQTAKADIAWTSIVYLGDEWIAPNIVSKIWKYTYNWATDTSTNNMYFGDLIAPLAGSLGIDAVLGMQNAGYSTLPNVGILRNIHNDPSSITVDWAYKVPGPIAGAGLPALLALFGYGVWRRKAVV
jgi:hypothetical protein